MLTAYNVLKMVTAETNFTATDYDQLVNDFQASFWKSRNFHEALSLHRKPQEYKQEVLQDLYDLTTRIQQRPELRDFDPVKKSQGYSHVRIQEIWGQDKRLRSIFNASRKYCEFSGKDFNTTLIHVAEYRALNLLIKKLRRAIYRASVPIVAAVPSKETLAPKKRKGISAKVRRELQKEVNSKCPFCNNDEVAIHEVHHIDEDRSNDTFANLIHVCGNCHSKITVGTISPEAVVAMKQKLLTKKHISTSTKARVHVQSDVTNITTGDHASITVKKTSKKVIQQFPPGCIGYEVEKANYISYLIGRYNECKLWETGKEQMNYAIIYKQLKHQFKIGNRNLLNLPLERFEELAGNLQQRIDKTKLAKVKGIGHKNYSTFEEYKSSAVNT